MSALFIVAIPLGASLTLAAMVGILTDRVRVDGSYGLWLAALLSGTAALAVAAVARGFRGFVIGSLAGASVLPATLLLKLLRWPAAPILGDGGDFVLLVCAAAAIGGAAIGAQRRGVAAALATTSSDPG